MYSGHGCFAILKSSSFSLLTCAPSPSSSPSCRRFSRFAPTTTIRANVVYSSVQSSTILPPLPENRTVVGCGLVSMDFLATVAAFPTPDDKIRSTSLKVEGGGNAANTLTCAARLGLNPRLITKVASDAQGKVLQEELEADGVDTSFLVVSKEGNSPFSYIIVDNQMNTRTCIHTPGFPPFIPDDLSKSTLLSALDGARVVYIDGILPEASLVVAQEAKRSGIPILIGAEMGWGKLDDLLSLSDYVVCSKEFPQAWTEAPSLPSALLSMLLRLPKAKFVIVTLGEDGCIMLERELTEGARFEELDIDALLKSLKLRIKNETTMPTCISSKVGKLQGQGFGRVNGRILVGTAEKIPPSELADTTGAGDAFIGGVLFALCANMPPEKMLPFAAEVAAAGCKALGARAGLPRRLDPRLAPFLH